MAPVKGASSPLDRLRSLQASARERRSQALAAALDGAAQGFVEDDNALDFTPTAMLTDVDLINATVDHLCGDAGFPCGALHTIAVKANPVGGVLRLLLNRGMGAEVASLGELAQALHVGFPPDRIVFDSPAKTRAELAYALSMGVPTNLDNFQELERAAGLMAAHPEWRDRPGGLLVGLRINPQVGAGSIAALSTGGAVSKFGFPLAECRDRLVAAFVEYPWLNMLHLHVGSQGLPTSLIVEGASRVWGLLEEIEAAVGKRRVKVMDIGGGLSVDFSTDTPGPFDDECKAAGGDAAAGCPHWTRFQEQAALLRQRVPGLWDPSRGVRLVTENGRSLLAKAACVVSQVEYTKASGGRRIAVCHTGADLLTRACYMPDTWGLRIDVCDGKGEYRGQGRGDPLVEQDIAGPLCFQGDRVATAALLPQAEVGDWIMVLDAGAYTLSMASRYNSRCSPAVWGYSDQPGGLEGAEVRGGETEVAAAVNGSGGAVAADGGGGAMRLCKLRGRETLQQVLAYWNL